MRLSIDRFGRVLLPKALRVQLGLAPGSVLDAEQYGQELRLKSASSQPLLIEEDGVLVFTGAARKELREAVTRLRDERLERVG